MKKSYSSRTFGTITSQILFCGDGNRKKVVVPDGTSGTVTFQNSKIWRQKCCKFQVSKTYSSGTFGTINVQNSKNQKGSGKKNMQIPPVYQNV